MFGEYKKVTEADRASAWQMDSSSDEVKEIATRELDMHENYMRRTLTKRFKYCQKYDPFTDEDLVKFAYSLAIDCRTSGPYKHLLKNLDAYLYEMPYANTGVAFSGQAEVAKTLVGRQHNKFVEFQNMSLDVSDKLLNGMLVNSKIINKGALKYVLNAWKKDASLSHLLSRLYGIEKFIEEFGVMPRSLNRRFYEDSVSIGMARLHHGAKRLKRALFP
jgi:hypothetical protein